MLQFIALPWLPASKQLCNHMDWRSPNNVALFINYNLGLLFIVYQTQPGLIDTIWEWSIGMFIYFVFSILPCLFQVRRVQMWWHHIFFFFFISAFLDTIYRWSIMKNIHIPNLVGIGSWGPEKWPHEYLISPIEINANWPGSKQLWTRPIYNSFQWG